MIWYFLGTILVVFGIIAVLIFLALSSVNRGVSIQPPQPQQLNQSTGSFEKWGKRIGWIIFGLIVLDLLQKFVFPNIPIEWKEWIPGFSWNTVEVVVVIAGIVILWNQAKKKEDTPCGDAKKCAEKGKVAPKKTFAVIKLLIAAGLGVFAYTMYEYQLAHVGELVTSVESGYLYIPLHGLLFAMAAMILSIILTEFSLVDLLAWFSFPVFLVLGMWNHWFMPHLDDFVLPSWYILFGGAIAVSLLFLRMEDGYLRTQSTVNCILVVIAVWLPQLVLL